MTAPTLDLVLFDMDDVLCDYSRPARAAHFARLAGRTTEFVLDAIWGSGFEALADAGLVEPADYVRGCGERIGHPLTVDDWIDARRAAMRPRPDVLAVVARIRDQTTVAVLTNNSALLVEHVDRIYPELVPLFGDRIHASSTFRALKPDPECYLRCLDRLAARPGRTLFVDDLPENVAGAERAGLHGHRYTSVDALVAVLRTHGLG